MNLYAVRIVTNIVVSAPDEDSARRVALDSEREQRRHAEAEQVSKIISPADLPPKWDDGCLPWGRDDEVTIGEILGSRS